MEQIEARLLKGITDGKKVFSGPRVAQIDLTGRCDNNCIGCWVHSPFIKNPPRDKNVTLSLQKAKGLIESLALLGTEEIYLSGAGEAFLHPNILEIIALIKEKGLKLNVITNFSLIDEDKARRLVELKVDLITASIWAGTEETYIKTHPSKTKEYFYKIQANLKAISKIKLKYNTHLPQVKIYDVICNLNYAEINRMVDFALDAQVDFIEFQIMDIVEGDTSFLALSDTQIKQTKEQFDALTKRSDLYFKELQSFNPKISADKELKEFPGRFLKLPDKFLLEEFIEEQVKGKKEVLHSLICPKGLRSITSSRNPLIEEDQNKLTFSYLKENCSQCSLFGQSCPVNADSKISLKYLKLLAFNSFMRRLNSGDIYKQVYEKGLINRIPCYAGWVYSRVLSTGEVIPCCKATNKPLGNIYKDSFLNIWNSKKYSEFRNKAKFMPKDQLYFKEINCFKSCDNVGMNLAINDALLACKENKSICSGAGISKIAGGACLLPAAKEQIVVPAPDYKQGNFNSKDHQFGKGIVIDGGFGFGFAEYDMHVQNAGWYDLWSRYASDEQRPVELYLDGLLIAARAMGYQTGGWTTEELRWFKEISLELTSGPHTFKIHTKGIIPHIHSVAFLKEVRGISRIKHVGSSEIIYQKPSGLRMLKDKFRNMGFIASGIKLFDYIVSGRLVNNYLDILGIFNSSYAFGGPFHVQVDLTNDCNNNCIGCWCNSPLLEEKALPPDVKKQFLPLGLVKETFDELSRIGTKEIYFSGSGEPFMHPEIMEVLEYAKRKKFTCYVNTNFTLLDKEKIKRLVDLGIDHFTVSTWVATAKTYAITHPNQSEETFKKIVENLKFLNSIKKKAPHIKLYNVIFNLNYHELKGMIELAKETNSESVEFTLIDTMPGKTDKLLLDSRQIKELQAEANQIKGCLDRHGCYEGVLLFRFDSFLRRISSAADLSTATYDRNIIDKMPCYIGWCFSRIIPNGDVHACLKAHRIPTGNLYQSSFTEIWNSQKQRNFRKKTLVYEKKDPFFRLIGNDPEIKEAGCYKSCDDIGRNSYMHNRILSLTYLERKVLQIVARLKKKPRLPSKDACKSVDPIIQGIHNGRQAFAGPEQVVVDLTNRCNERCAGCWLYSPLLKEKPDDGLLKKEIDFSAVKNLIDDLAGLGTKRLRFTGGGEPFMHPKIMDILEYTKKRGLICCVTTNFSLVDKEKVEKLAALPVDELAVSLWASDEATYLATHPGTLPQRFQRIKENIKILTSRKKDKPFLTLCNVICNLNYTKIEEMFNFAVEMQADGLYFTLIDSLAGTDALLLNEEQKEAALKQAEAVEKAWSGLPEAKRIKLDYFDGFLQRLKQKSSLDGRYDQERVEAIPCYAGWIFSRVLVDGSIVPCCRGVKKIMGNINQRPFKEIWFSEKYNAFRAKAKYLPKSGPYFSDIGCVKMCDNLMHNEEMHRRV